MSKTLTIRQFADLLLGKDENPLHLGDLLTEAKRSVLPIRNSLEKLSRAQTFLYVTLITRANLANLLGFTPSNIQNAVGQIRASLQRDESTYWISWAQAWLSGGQQAQGPAVPQGYATLYNRLQSVGASIFYLSPAVSLPSNDPDLGPGTLPGWSVIGIAGPFGGLANLGGQILPFWLGGANGWTDDDWNTIAGFAGSGDDLLLAPAQLIPAIWQAAQGNVNGLPYTNMLLLSGS